MLQTKFLTAREDEKLRRRLKMCRQGSKAWMALRNHFMGSMEALVYRTAILLHRQGFGEVDDHVQSIFLFMMKRFNSFDPAYGVKFCTWATYCIRSAATEIRRVENQRRKLPCEYLGERDFGRPSDISLEVAHKLDSRRFLRGLHQRERDVIKELALSDKNMQDIATDQGVCRERIRQIYMRGVRRIRAKCESYPF